MRPAVTSRSWAAPAYGGCSASSGSDKISTCGRGLIERFADVRSTSFAGVRPMVSVDIARVDDLLRLAHEHGFDYEDDPHSRGTDLLGACSSFSSDDAAAPTDAGNAGANLADSAGLDAGNADAASEPFCASLSPKSAPRRPALRDSRFASDGDVDSAALSDAVLDAVTLSVALGAEHLALAARLTCGILELPRGGGPPVWIPPAHTGTCGSSGSCSGSMGGSNFGAMPPPVSGPGLEPTTSLLALLEISSLTSEV